MCRAWDRFAFCLCGVGTWVAQELSICFALFTNEKTLADLVRLSTTIGTISCNEGYMISMMRRNAAERRRKQLLGVGRCGVSISTALPRPELHPGRLQLFRPGAHEAP